MQHYLIIIPVLLLQTMTDTNGQKLTLDVPRRLTPCGNHLRAGIDKYMITGRAGTNFKNYLTKGWENKVSVHVMPKMASQFEEICSITVDTTTCDPDSTSMCYCDNVNLEAIFVAKVLAESKHSDSLVRAEWRNTNGTVIYSDLNQTLPQIYGKQDAQIELVVNQQPRTLSLNGTCSFGFNPLVPNTIHMCCASTALPCFPRIAVNKQLVVDNATGCADHKFTPGYSYSAVIELSYSACTRSDYTLVNNCTGASGLPDNIGGATNYLLVVMAVFGSLIFVLCTIGSTVWCILNKSYKTLFGGNKPKRGK